MRSPASFVGVRQARLQHVAAFAADEADRRDAVDVDRDRVASAARCRVDPE
jgi:hypothetical protein